MTDRTLSALSPPAEASPLRPRFGGIYKQVVFRRFRRHQGAVVGAVILLLLVICAILAPWIAVYDPLQAIPGDRTLPPSPSHPFGTDRLGRDVLTRILFGARLSLWVGLATVVIGLVPGVILGIMAGYYGRAVDLIAMRFVDVMLTFPRILLALTLVFVLGISLINVIVAIGISSIPAYARLVRSSVLSVRALTYVEAARVVGCRNGRIMGIHILPNIVAPVLVLATLEVGAAILAVSGLSFLGMGVQPPTPEWGAMLSDGRALLRNAWWISAFPGITIMLVVLAINLIGDGLRDALDVRLRGS